MAEKTETNGQGDADKALEDKIIRQIEYYFGDANLMKDKFLQAETKKDDGWVNLDTLLTFQRLKSITTDKDVIVKALRKSSAQLLEINEEEFKIRRSVDRPLPENNEEFKLQKEARTVYAKGFPADSTLDELIEFFESHGGAISVYMRRFLHDKKFKGSVFAELKSEEAAAQFLNAKEILYKEKPLARETSKAYLARKAKERASKEAKRQRKNNTESAESNSNVDEKGDADSKFELKKGCVLYLVGLPTEGCSRETIKEVFDNHAEVAWVDFSRGDTEAWIRFREEGAASGALEKAIEKSDGKLVIKDTEIDVSILEGEEEVTYWKKIKEMVQKSRDRSQRFSQGRGKGRGRGRGGARTECRRKWRDRSAEGRDKVAASGKITKFESDSEEDSKKDDSPSRKRKQSSEDTSESLPPKKEPKVEAAVEDTSESLRPIKEPKVEAAVE